jgi:hypothetical protein
MSSQKGSALAKNAAAMTRVLNDLLLQNKSPWEIVMGGTTVNLEEKEKLLSRYMLFRLAGVITSFPMIEYTWNQPDQAWNSESKDVTIPVGTLAKITSPYTQKAREMFIAPSRVDSDSVLDNLVRQDEFLVLPDGKGPFQSLATLSNSTLFEPNKPANITVFASSVPSNATLPDWLPEQIDESDELWKGGLVTLRHWPCDVLPCTLSPAKVATLLAPWIRDDDVAAPFASDDTPVAIKALFAECLYKVTTNPETYSAVILDNSMRFTR